jgi:sulfur-oxidizing protein SoxX
MSSFKPRQHGRVWASLATALAAAAVVAGCASGGTPLSLDTAFAAMMKSSFRDEGIATVDRLQQDATQAACSTGQPPDEATAKRLETAALATIKPPSDGQYLGDWKEGEKLAQNGRGMTWTDKSALPAANGANCYNCHQISPSEISFGTIGPSLYNYGKLRGVSNPADPAAAPIVQYTWGKLMNATAYNACSNMPRFGHKGLLDEKQIQHVMALLLDPKSPVNAQ